MDAKIQAATERREELEGLPRDWRRRADGLGTSAPDEAAALQDAAQDLDACLLTDHDILTLARRLLVKYTHSMHGGVPGDAQRAHLLHADALLALMALRAAGPGPVPAPAPPLRVVPDGR